MSVFSVEDVTAQVVWSDLGGGTAQFDVDGRRLEIEVEPGPGALLLDGLRPDTSYTLTVTSAADDRSRRRIRTLSSPPGEELFRFATVSDLHLGRGEETYRAPDLRSARGAKPTGPSPTAPKRPHKSSRGDALADDPGPGAGRQLVSATAAVAEALEWGAQRLVVKGDLCDQSYDWIWDQAAMLLGDLPVPVSILPGNHDTGSLRHFEPEHGARVRGLHLTRGVEHVDVPGLRIILMDSAVPGNGWGSVRRHAEHVAQLTAEARSGSFIATHHHAQRFTVPLFWPHGIPGREAALFSTAVHAASPNVLISSGHTHRCRRRSVHGLDWTEVAATSHFPAVWAGYVVHEGGLRQIVRRIADPAVMRWAEHTRHVLGGVWALWSTGDLSDRCFTVDWT